MADFMNMLVGAFSVVSGAVTLRDARQAHEQTTAAEELAALTAGFDYARIEGDFIRYAEAADRYVQDKHDRVVGRRLISDEERASFKSEFYRLNPGALSYKATLDPVLTSFLDNLDRLLRKSLTSGEKFVAMEVDGVGARLERMLAGNASVIDDKLVDISTGVARIDQNLQRLLDGRSADCSLLDKYYEKYRKRFEEKPDKDNAELVGGLSLKESFIDITVDKGKAIKGRSAVEVIRGWFNGEEPGVRLLSGEPGHGKTTIGYKLVYDFITGAAEYRGNVFFFPLVSSTYSIVSSEDTIDILAAMRLVKFDKNSTLSADLIDGSLIILDGYDELQVALGNGSQFSNLPTFFGVLREFAEHYNAHILLTSRSASVNVKEPGMKEVNKRCLKMNAMRSDQQDAWIIEHRSSYLQKFELQRERFASVSESGSDILGIPFVFVLMVSAEFDDEVGNLVDLYDKLFAATFARRGVIDEGKVREEHLGYEMLAAKIYEQGDQRALVSSLGEHARLNLFAFSYYVTVNRDAGGEDEGDAIDSAGESADAGIEHVAGGDVDTASDADANTGYYEFYHRTFYEYFLAWSFYRDFETLKDARGFLRRLSYGVPSEYVRKYLRQIKDNKGGDEARYRDSVDALLKCVESTDAVVTIEGEDGSFDRCNTAFVAALSFARVFVEHLIIHEAPTIAFSHYEDTTLCRLLRSYKCHHVDLGGAVMTGGHFGYADFRRACLVGADLSGRVDASFLVATGTDFTGANMDGADLYRAHADRALFRLACLHGARLEDSSCKAADFEGADLRGANFARATLCGASLEGIRVDEGTSFVNADVQGMRTDVDLSMVKGMERFWELVEDGTIVWAGSGAPGVDTGADGPVAPSAMEKAP